MALHTKTYALLSSGINKSIKDISGVLITHEHSDHIKGIVQLCKNNPELKIYTTEKTKLAIQELLCEKNILADIYGLQYGDNFDIGDFNITVIETSHDAVMPCAYNIKDKNSTITYATDLGYISDTMQNFLNTSNCNILESNFDKIMLEYGPYPASIKSRIRGMQGHLSNEDTAKAIATTLSYNPEAKFILSHLSENNNTEALAKDTIFSYLKEQNVENTDISFASQSLSFERYEV
ncbi:MAG: MBL fold metallo-hydrolase [Clostridia bacterium]|nr:MBL fold metallo-hydrolase [Clostridia bacterium]